jgi:hypothetical protein
MLTFNKANSDKRPEQIEALGNGTYYYNYNIEEVTKTDEFTNEEHTSYEYNYILIAGEPTYANCVKAAIREYIDESKEFDLINSYNAYLLNGTDEEAKSKYMDYLSTVQEIKSFIKTDLAA